MSHRDLKDKIWFPVYHCLVVSGSILDLNGEKHRFNEWQKTIGVMGPICLDLTGLYYCCLLRSSTRKWDIHSGTDFTISCILLRLIICDYVKSAIIEKIVSIYVFSQKITLLLGPNSKCCGRLL